MKAVEWLLKGDYESFTACQDKQKLTPESFKKMSEYTSGILKDDEALDAMITFMVINDLGKIQKVVDQLAEETGTHNVDHDKILLSALEKNGDKVSPSYGRLSPQLVFQLARDGTQAVHVFAIQARADGVGEMAQGKVVGQADRLFHLLFKAGRSFGAGRHLYVRVLIGGKHGVHFAQQVFGRALCLAKVVVGHFLRI